MNITADTNLLVRVIVRDDLQQAKLANDVLQNASSIAITPTAFCELIWVLGRVYKRPASEGLAAVEALLNVRNVVTDRLAIENGLAMLRAGRDFADGVIAYEGRRLGANVFVSFDKNAVSQLRKQGFEAQLPGKD